MVNDYNTKVPSLPWLVMYSNSGDIGILDVLAVKQAECATTGIVDFFVPLEVTRLAIEGRSVAHKRLIAGNYIFIRATREDILRLRQEPPYEVQQLRLAVGKMDGEVEYFVPTSKELIIGDYVRIIEGKYSDIKGVLESVKGHEGGRVIVALRDVLAVRTPRIQASNLQLLELAKAGDSLTGSYTSRAYKKVRGLTADSERLLDEREKTGKLSEQSVDEANRLLLRFTELKLSGKIRTMHAAAICNILLALGETESERYFHFKNILP